ncbi:hypothetical protein NXS19_007260 [Fusarium pseudograminearum]|nr:hypothetical protein NXS19_007260 [Fusarium pseudograminearum]
MHDGKLWTCQTSPTPGGESSKTGQQLIYQSNTNNYDDLDNAGAPTAGENVTADGQGSGEPPRGPGNLYCYCDCNWESTTCRCSNCYCVRCRCTRRFSRRLRGPLKPPAHGCLRTRKIAKTNRHFRERSPCYMRHRRMTSSAAAIRRCRQITGLMLPALTARDEVADELQTGIRALSLERLPDTGYAIDGRGPDSNFDTPHEMRLPSPATGFSPEGSLATEQVPLENQRNSDDPSVTPQIGTATPVGLSAESQGEHLADRTEDRGTLDVSDATDPVTSSQHRLLYIRRLRRMGLTPPFPRPPNCPDYTPSFLRPIDEYSRLLTIRTPNSDSDETDDRTVSEDWAAERAELEQGEREEAEREQAERERFQMVFNNEVLESVDKDESIKEESDSDVNMEEASDLDVTKEESDTE